MKRVLLVNWDSYPNVTSGGVYSWEKTLVESMSDYRFTIINLLSNPNGNGKFSVPDHVSKVIGVPIFGSNRYEEFYDEGQSLLSKIMRTKESVIREKFLPLYKEFLSNIMSDSCKPERLSDIIFKMHQFFAMHDCKKCFEHPLAWDVFMEQIEGDRLYREMTIREAFTAFQMLQRNMQVLSIKVPPVDIVHCSLAWFPALIAIFAKKENNCPIIITEHGVAFRELLLYYNAYLIDEPANIFWKVFSRNIVRALYAVADVINPVCYANAVWEENLGVDPAKIKVIYNGVDTARFKPIETKREGEAARPTIACVGRVDIFKDILNLIQSVKYVREKVPDVQCIIYGSSIDLDYSMRCVNAVKSLGLEETVRFAGKVKDPERAYNSTDVVVISSITEGFPFAVIEAMACGKAVVATDVGGTAEALEGCGVLVRSSHPHELANAVVRLLFDKQKRDELGAAALKRANEQFTLKQSLDQFRAEYERLIEKRDGSGGMESQALEAGVVA